MFYLTQLVAGKWYTVEDGNGLVQPRRFSTEKEAVEYAKGIVRIHQPCRVYHEGNVNGGCTLVKTVIAV